MQQTVISSSTGLAPEPPAAVGFTQAGTHIQYSGKTELVSFVAAYADVREPQGAPLEDDLEELRELLGVAEDPPVDAQVDSDDAPDAESQQELQRLLAHVHHPVSAGSDYSVLQVWQVVGIEVQQCSRCVASTQRVRCNCGLLRSCMHPSVMHTRTSMGLCHRACILH